MSKNSFPPFTLNPSPTGRGVEVRERNKPINDKEFGHDQP